MNPLTFHLYANTQQYNNTLNNAVQLSDRITNRITNNMRTIYNSSMKNDQSVRNVGNTTIKYDMRENVQKSNLFGNIAKYTGIYLAIRTIESAITGVIHQSIEWSKHTIQLAASYERSKIAFEVMVGDAVKGQQLLGDLTRLAIRTPFVTEDLTRGAQMLLGMGVKLEAVMPSMERLGDIAAGDAEKLRRLALAFGQVVAAGRFMGTELRQFTEAGVGAGDFAKAIGMSTREFRERMREGVLGSDAMIKGINALTERGGRFYQMNERQNKTVIGQWNSLKETVDQILRETGVDLFEKYNVAGKLGQLREWASENLGGYIESIVSTLETAGSMIQEAMMDIFNTTNFNMALTEFRDLAVSSFNTVLAVARTIIPILITLFDILSPIIRFIQFSISGLMVSVNGLQAMLGGLVYGMGYKTVGTKMYLSAQDNIRDIAKHLDVQGDLLLGGIEKQAKKFNIEDYRRSGGVYQLPKNFTQKDMDALRKTDPEQHARINNALFEGKIIGQMKDFGQGMMIRTMQGWQSKTDPRKIIPFDFNFSPDLQKMADKIRKSIEEGTTPYEKFINQIAKLQQAANPLFDPLSGDKLQDPLLNRNQFRQGLLEQFREAERSLKQREMQLPKALYFGSAEAQDAVNEAQMQKTETVEEKTLRVIEEMEKTSKLQLEEDKKIKDILERTYTKPVAIKKGP